MCTTSETLGKVRVGVRGRGRFRGRSGFRATFLGYLEHSASCEVCPRAVRLG